MSGGMSSFFSRKSHFSPFAWPHHHQLAASLGLLTFFSCRATCLPSLLSISISHLLMPSAAPPPTSQQPYKHSSTFTSPQSSSLICQHMSHSKENPQSPTHKRLLPFEAQLQHRPGAARCHTRAASSQGRREGRLRRGVHSRCELVVDVLGLDGLVDGHSHHNVTPVVLRSWRHGRHTAGSELYLVPIRQASSSQTQSLRAPCL